MKKLFSVLLAALLLCSLCGVAAAADNAEEVSGTYTLISAMSEEDGDLSETIQIMNNIGMTSTLTVNADGSGLLDLFGEEHVLHFDFVGETFTSDDEEGALPYRYEDGQITIGDESSSFVFSKEGLAETKKPFQGPFRYYTLNDVKTEGGESVLDDYIERDDEAAGVSLCLFEDGSALFRDLDDTLEMYFDFEKMTVEVDGDIYPFSLANTVLVITNDNEEYIVLEQADPGFEGPYVMTSLVTEGEGDMTDQLKVLDAVGMLPKLTAEADSSAVLDLFDEQLHLQFDFETMQVEMEGESMPFTYEYGLLLIGDETNSMGFARILPEAEES